MYIHLLILSNHYESSANRQHKKSLITPRKEKLAQSLCDSKIYQRDQISIVYRFERFLMIQTQRGPVASLKMSAIGELHLQTQPNLSNHYECSDSRQHKNIKYYHYPEKRKTSIKHVSFINKINELKLV